MSNYRNNPAQLAEIFKALSNSHRLEIFKRLSTCCEPGTACSLDAARMCVSDIGSDLAIAPSTLSHHLKELSRAGLIKTQRKGKQIECWVDLKTVQNTIHFFEQLLKETGYGKE